MSTTTEQEFIGEDPTASTTTPAKDPNAPADPDAPEPKEHQHTADCAGTCPQRP